MDRYAFMLGIQDAYSKSSYVLFPEPNARSFDAIRMFVCSQLIWSAEG